MIAIGNQNMAALYLGNQRLRKAYLGKDLILDTVKPPTPAYTITVSVDPAGGGSAAGAGVYQQEESVTVSASPADGYQFTAWKVNGAAVSENTSYTFPASADMDLTAVFEMEKVSRLPEGYIELEYVQGGPSAVAGRMPYIQMTEHPTATKLEFTFRDPNTAASVSNGTFPFYGYDIMPNSNNSTRTYFLIGLMSKYENSKYVPYVTINYGNNNARKYTVQFVTDTKYTVVMDSIEKTIVVNGESFAGTARTYWRNAKNVLFTWIVTANGISPAYRKNVCIYELKMWDAEGTLVCDMVPCKNDSGEIGFYDVIEQLFYGNANTSTNENNYFTAGPTV